MFIQEIKRLPWIEDFNRSKQPRLQRDERPGDPAGAFITVPLLTRGQFRERPQRQRRSRPRGSECSSSAGGTSPSPERNLGNRKDGTAPIITCGVTKRAAPGRASCDDCSLSKFQTITMFWFWPGASKNTYWGKQMKGNCSSNAPRRLKCLIFQV